LAKDGSNLSGDAFLHAKGGKIESEPNLLEFGDQRFLASCTLV
jgi:hypothetical protein